MTASRARTELLTAGLIALMMALICIVFPWAVSADTAVDLPDWAAAMLTETDEPAETPLEQVTVINTATSTLGDGAAAINGQWITYTLTISNSTPISITDVTVLDLLPEDALTEIEVPPTCERIVETQVIPDPLGESITVTRTRQIRWQIAEVPAHSSVSTSFSGRITGQTDGTELTNVAFFEYRQDGGRSSGMSNKAKTIVGVSYAREGAPAFALAPTWISEDLGGSLCLDWGDYDGDGDRDLAVASTVGTSVYRNDQGRLVRIWSNDRLTFGVSWFDLVGDGTLALVAVGQSIDGTPTTAGTNYIYLPDGDSFRELAFASNEQLVRVAPGDYDGDGDNDIMVSTNGINAEHPVKVYTNSGIADHWFDASPLVPRYYGYEWNYATASLVSADYNGDSALDVALGVFANIMVVLGGINPGTSFDLGTIDYTPQFLPYDFAWGDYDADGLLDLAAAYPLERCARIYHADSSGNLVLTDEIRTGVFRTPLALDWADMDGDGSLDLIVADQPPRVYSWDGTDWTETMALSGAAVQGQIWSLEAADSDGDADMDLAMTNRDGASLMFTTAVAMLGSELRTVDGLSSTSLSSVGWGDVDNDKDMDLFFGAGEGVIASRIYLNNQGAFSTSYSKTFLPSGFGPHHTAYGDMNGDGLLDAAISLGTRNGIQVYLNEMEDQPDWEANSIGSASLSSTWVDVDGDEWLDLAVANDGPNAVYLNNEGILRDTPFWTSEETDDSRALAWADMDGDHDLDLAVANYNQPNRVYRNEGTGLTLVWSSTTISSTTAVSWVDVDNDGDMDLSFGNKGQANVIYTNRAGQLDEVPSWSSGDSFDTVAIDWADCNNDGRLDLAVANNGSPDQVYLNCGTQADTGARLQWAWASPSYNTTDISWGDADRDGDLDLAVSAQDAGSGYYENTCVVASHLDSNWERGMALPNNPGYVVVDKPGSGAATYESSSAEVLSGPANPEVTIHYTLYDPDGSRRPDLVPDAPGDTISSTDFEFSLDGGSTWNTATPAAGNTEPITTTSRMGQPGTFVWDAVADQAISDHALFRVSITNNSATDTKQASIAATSPPFRVRAVTELWPENPWITADKVEPRANEAVRFEGAVERGSGVLTFSWDFGDGSSGQGQAVEHAFEESGTYVVHLTVKSEPTPVVREVHALYTIAVDVSATDGRIANIPLILFQQEPEPISEPESPVQDGILTLATNLMSRTDEHTVAAPMWLTTEAERALQTDSNDLQRPVETLIERADETIGTPYDMDIQPVLDEWWNVSASTDLNEDGSDITFWSTTGYTGRNYDGSIEVFTGHNTGTFWEIKQLSESSGSILGGFNLAPNINNDGSSVVFFSDRDLVGNNPDANFEIYRWTSGGLEQLTDTDGGVNMQPTTNAAGSLVAFLSDRELVSGEKVSEGVQDVFLLDTATNTFTRLSNSEPGVVNDGPVLSQDGQRLAVISTGDWDAGADNADGSTEVFVCDISTGTWTQVTDTSSPTIVVRDVQIDATGDHLVFTSGDDLVWAKRSGDTYELSAIAPPTADGECSEPCISSDGERAGFVCDGEIYVYDSAGRVLTHVRTWTDEDIHDLAMSGTGIVVTFVTNRQLYVGSVPRADVAVEVVPNPDPMVPGQDASYLVTLSNDGPSPAPGTRLQISIPNGLHDVTWSGTSNSGPVSGTGHSIDEIVDLAWDGQVTYRIEGRLAASQVTTVTMPITATPASGVIDWQPQNNTLVHKTPIDGQADLMASMTAVKTRVNEQEQIQFELVIENMGPGDAPAAEVELEADSGLMIQSYTASQGTFSGATWSMGTLPMGEVAWLRLQVVAREGTAGSDLALAVAELRSAFRDTDVDNNAASHTLSVNTPPAPVSDSYTIAEGGTLDINKSSDGLLANDQDAEGDTLFIHTTPMTDTINGALTLFSNGTFDYVHNGSETVSDSFDYVVEDALGATSIGHVSISITPVNDAPTAISLSPSEIEENRALNTTVGLFSATDSDSDDFQYSLVSGAGDADNDLFTISDDLLLTAVVLDHEQAASRSIRVQVDDLSGGMYTEIITIYVVDVNDDPDSVTLSNSQVDENVTLGTLVGLLGLDDVDGPTPYSYEFVAGTGDTDNGSFSLDGNRLETAVELDYEQQSVYSLRVRGSDALGGYAEAVFSVIVGDINEAPTGLSLDNATIAENEPTGTRVGYLSGTDQDTGDSLSFALTSGPGDKDNDDFQILGNELQTARVLDYEADASREVRIGVTDSAGLTYERPFVIQLIDTNDAPTDIHMDSYEVVENQPSGTVVGHLDADDLDPTDTFTYALVSGSGDDDNGSFRIRNGNELQTKSVFDFETRANYSVRIRVTDSENNTFEKALTLSVTDANEAPTAITLDNSTVAEDASTGTVVGHLSASDPDAGDTHTYAITGDAAAQAAFEIVGDELRVKATLDYETTASYSLTVHATDGGGLTTSRTWTISVTDANEAPTAIVLDNTTVAEDATAGTVVGNLSASDPDAGDTHTYAITGDAAAQAAFEVVGDELRVKAALDYETTANYSLTVHATDSGGLMTSQTWTISVTDVPGV